MNDVGCRGNQAVSTSNPTTLRFFLLNSSAYTLGDRARPALARADTPHSIGLPRKRKTVACNPEYLAGALQ